MKLVLFLYGKIISALYNMVIKLYNAVFIQIFSTVKDPNFLNSRRFNAS